MQQLQHVEEQQRLAISAALQPIAAKGFCSAEGALARSQALAQVSDCLTALVSQHLGSNDVETTERIRNASASMFTAASVPRFASLAGSERENEMVQLACILVGRFLLHIL